MPYTKTHDALAAWVDQHGYTAENALQVYAARMRAIADEADDAGMPRYAGAFRESADKADDAAAALNAITEASMSAPGG